MLDHIRAVPGRILDRSAYHADFAREVSELNGVIWKLERAQSFREPGDSSWEAFRAGNWAGALAEFDAERPDIRRDARRNLDQGVGIRRVRVVEHPISPYLQWEMHSFRVLAEEGFDLRVLDAAELKEYERSRPLPEIVVVGEQVLYEVRYDPQWTPCGARRIRDHKLIRQAIEEIAELHRRGEPLLDFFHREIAPLPVPIG